MAGWTLTNLVCTGGGANTSTAGAVATIGLNPGEAVTCTYTNTQNASLDIEKLSVGGSGTFDYAVDGSGLAPFTRDTAVANPTTNAPFPFTGFQLGTKDVQETPEAGWTLTNIVCSPNGADITIGTGVAGTFAQGATAGFDPGDTTVRAVITAGDTPTCTYTNTADATLAIHKTTLGGDGTFDFDGVGAGVPADLDITTASGAGSYAGNPITFGPGQFDVKIVTETVPAGWMLTNIVCTGDPSHVIGRIVNNAFVNGGADGFDAGDTSILVTIDPGENVDCTFTNTQLVSLIIEKTVINDDGGTAVVDDFAITTDAGELVFRPP